jgi:hypothetical protein
MCIRYLWVDIKGIMAGFQWITPVILATEEAEIRRISGLKPARQIVCKTLSQKALHKNRAGRVAQSEGPEFTSSTTHTHKR